jgi:phosphoribosylaminoimidazole-succinocarboxamide synthase
MADFKSPSTSSFSMPASSRTPAETPAFWANAGLNITISDKVSITQSKHATTLRLGAVLAAMLSFWFALFDDCLIPNLHFRWE